MTTKKLTKLLALYLPYILLGLVATNFGEAWRLAEGKELGDKIMAMIPAIKSVPFSNHGCRMANGVAAVFPTVISGFPAISKPFM